MKHEYAKFLARRRYLEAQRAELRVGTRSSWIIQPTSTMARACLLSLLVAIYTPTACSQTRAPLEPRSGPLRSHLDPFFLLKSELRRESTFRFNQCATLEEEGKIKRYAVVSFCEKCSSGRSECFGDYALDLASYVQISLQYHYAKYDAICLECGKHCALKEQRRLPYGSAPEESVGNDEEVNCVECVDMCNEIAPGTQTAS